MSAHLYVTGQVQLIITLAAASSETWLDTGVCTVHQSQISIFQIHDKYSLSNVIISNRKRKIT